MSTVDKIELPLDLARALYKVYDLWNDTELDATEGYREIGDSDYYAIERAASTVDDLLTMEQITILGDPDAT
jgi:hypothetical protein